MDKRQSDLILPVYLNQRVVFDLVAMLQGGIATVTKVSEAQKGSENQGTARGGAFSLGSAFASLLKIDLSSKSTSGLTTEQGTTSQEERVHTPASLFHRLREQMGEKGHFVIDDEKCNPKPGDFLEFVAVLQKNPFLEALDTMVELMDLATSASPTTKKDRGGKAPEPDAKKLKTQFQSLADSLKVGDSIDLTTGTLKCGARAVLTIETQYLNDPLMSDLVDGTFKVLGKVSRFVAAGEGAISLLRKTALSRMPKASLDQVMQGFTNLNVSTGMSLPAMESEIPGPVLQVLPIAIFA